MKIITYKEIISAGPFKASPEYKVIHSDIVDAIASVSWDDPHEFIINPVKKGNGVVPIKNNFVGHLIKKFWKPEMRMPVVKGMRPGPIDAVKSTVHGNIAIEWETGNISSSHRALNKIAVGIIQKQLIAGFLVLPHKNLAQYLTDRIGNYEEIAPYFPMYSKLKIDTGYIGVFGVEHDSESTNAVLIPKGKDGNSKKKK